MTKPDLDLLRESLESNERVLSDLMDTAENNRTDADEVLRRLVGVVTAMNLSLIELCRELGEDMH